jgi:thiol-disulfide isomerase/thioredoxin
VVYPFDYESVSFPVDEKGKFSGEIDAFSVHPVSVYWLGYDVRCFIASDETTSIILNPAEMSRRKSRLLGDKPSLGEPVYYGGYLASLSKELEALSVFSLQHDRDYDGWKSFVKCIETKNPETLKEFFLNEYQTKKAELEALNVSPACKQILHYSISFYCANDIVNIASRSDGYIFNNQLLKNDKEVVANYYTSGKFDLPDDFYNVLKDFSFLNDPQILYTRSAMTFSSPRKDINLQLIFSKALGTDYGIIFDLMKVSNIYDNIKNFRPVDEAQIQQLPADFQEFIRLKNEELLQLLEANKSKTGYVVNDVAQVADDEDIFLFILSKFRGKPILLDFWETWCGPCREGNKELKPVKAELADKDIVYVYAASESSPLETWKNITAGVPGEHFRLSMKQRNYVTKALAIEGVPTYFFIDRQGNIKEKQVGFPGVQQMKEKLLQLLE